LSEEKTHCEFEVPGQEVWELNGERYKGCPFKIVTKKSANFLRAFNFYKQGYLPNSGAWLEQSAKMLDAFEVIERELQTIKDEREKKKRRFRQ